MPIDTWFPLAIYYADLDESAKHKYGLAGAIRELHGRAVEKRSAEFAAWTGDVHSVERIHQIPLFHWINEQVEYHALVYLDALGHDLQKLELYVQRAWPVISGKGQRVASHAHHTAHLSAVYYVEVPGGPESGRLRFHNTARQNELSPGIGLGMTSGYRSFSVLNFGETVYEPVEGRILLFPAKQPHSVDINETETERLSLSYDLVLTMREESDPGLHEFLTPPPSQWRRCKRYEDYKSPD